MLNPRTPAQPEKELRFTRARQAVLFGMLGIFFLAVTIGTGIASSPWWNPPGGPPLISQPVWVVLPLLAALFCFWVFAFLVRHAYLILTPLGIELFPFWFPKKNLQVFYWSEITDASVDGELRQMVIDLEGGGKVFATLEPIRKDRRPLLKRALDGRMLGKSKD